MLIVCMMLQCNARGPNVAYQIKTAVFMNRRSVTCCLLFDISHMTSLFIYVLHDKRMPTIHLSAWGRSSFAHSEKVGQQIPSMFWTSFEVSKYRTLSQALFLCNICVVFRPVLAFRDLLFYPRLDKCHRRSQIFSIAFRRF